MSLPVRTLLPTELDAAWEVLETAFAGAPHPDDREAELGVVEADRFYAAFDADAPVATAGSFAFDLAVPGAVLPAAGVTWVGVLPTHRRRGLLTALMTRQLADLHAEGRPVAALWASEGGIYGRFGYACAAWAMHVTVPRGAAFVRPVPDGGLRSVDPASPELPQVYARVAPASPGWPARDAAWWRSRLHDPEHSRSGAGPLRAVVADGPDGVDGYALYSTVASWNAVPLPDGTVRVRELVAATPQAHARLWRYLTDLDLTTTTVARLVAPDDPVLHLLADPRSARPALRDTLWVRLVDLPGALSGRRYAAPLDVVVEVTDTHLPSNAGRWRLTGGTAGAVCTPTGDPADLALDTTDLAAAYLGGVTLSSRAGAGRVTEHTPGTLVATSTAFGSARMPWCPMVF